MTKTEAEQMVGQAVGVTGRHCDECSCVKCLCLCDKQGVCKACFHVDEDGDACLCLVAGDGTKTHTKLAALVALVKP